MLKLADWTKTQSARLGHIRRNRLRRGLDPMAPLALDGFNLPAAASRAFVKFARLVSGRAAETFRHRVYEYAAKEAAQTGEILVSRKAFGRVVLSREYDLVGEALGTRVYDALLESGLATPLGDVTGLLAEGSPGDVTTPDLVTSPDVAQHTARDASGDVTDGLASSARSPARDAGRARARDAPRVRARTSRDARTTSNPGPGDVTKSSATHAPVTPLTGPGTESSSQDPTTGAAPSPARPEGRSGAAPAGAPGASEQPRRAAATATAASLPPALAAAERARCDIQTPLAVKLSGVALEGGPGSDGARGLLREHPRGSDWTERARAFVAAHVVEATAGGGP